MPIRGVFCVFVLLTLLLASCGSEKSDSERTHLGGCILLSPAAEAPSDLYQENDIMPTDEYRPFTKKITVYGLTLIGRDDISDDFMRKVAKTIQEMFPQSQDIDGELQKEILKNMYKYKAVIPFFKGQDHEFQPLEQANWDLTKSQNSVCDIIMEGVPGQVTEVVEHILHYVTDIGLHYTFPDEWGISKTSQLYQAMREAVDNQFYDISQYSDIEDDEARERVLLQEYAYWLIYTAWDLREPYGPREAEWSIMDSSDLKAKLPQSYQLYVETITKVMAVPGRATLEEFVN